MLLSTNDGVRSAPYEPSQIAGRDVLVVTPTGTRRGGMMGDPTGPVWGGMPGTMGRPQRLPGNGGGIGNAPGETENTVKVDDDTKKDKDKDSKPNPVLAALKEKMLPQKEVTDPVSGLLYFDMESKKLKPKDLEMYYKTPSGRISMRFKP